MKKVFKGFCKNCLYGLLKPISGLIRCKVNGKLYRPHTKCHITIKKKIKNIDDLLTG